MPRFLRFFTESLKLMENSSSKLNFGQIHLKLGPISNPEYSLSLFDHFCPVKRNGEYFAEKWSEQKVLIIKVVGIYSTYQKYKRIDGPSSYQFRENWT